MSTSCFAGMNQQSASLTSSPAISTEEKPVLFVCQSELKEEPPPPMKDLDTEAAESNKHRQPQHFRPRFVCLTLCSLKLWQQCHPTLIQPVLPAWPALISVPSTAFIAFCYDCGLFLPF